MGGSEQRSLGFFCFRFAEGRFSQCDKRFTHPPRLSRPSAVRQAAPRTPPPRLRRGGRARPAGPAGARRLPSSLSSDPGQSPQGCLTGGRGYQWGSLPSRGFGRPHRPRVRLAAALAALGRRGRCPSALMREPPPPLAAAQAAWRTKLIFYSCSGAGLMNPLVAARRLNLSRLCNCSDSF